LLAAVVNTVADKGLGSRSLRDIAADVGTSHRMLIHHFGSRAGLMVAVVQDVERRQANALSTLQGSPAERVADAWTRLSQAELRPFERLFFESYARGVNGESPFDRLIPSAVDSWLATPGDEPDADPALTRLGLAVIRGLLLDLVATGADTATSAALARFVELLQSEPDQPDTSTRRRSATPRPAVTRTSSDPIN
jgi:AcrR family transcriptional regulator